MRLWKDKKGDKLTEIIFSLILVGIMTVVIVIIFKGQALSSSRVMGKYIESVSEDYDGDGINDYFDKSPCVAGQDIIIDQKTGKIAYFFADMPKGGECDSVPHQKGYKIVEAVDGNTNQEVCVLTSSSCARALKSFYECLRSANKNKQGADACYD